MTLNNYRSMDPNLLYSLVNTRLRNDHRDLDDLVRSHDLDPEVLVQRLASAGFVYVAELNQFRPR